MCVYTHIHDPYVNRRRSVTRYWEHLSIAISLITAAFNDSTHTHATSSEHGINTSVCARLMNVIFYRTSMLLAWKNKKKKLHCPSTFLSNGQLTSRKFFHLWQSLTIDDKQLGLCTFTCTRLQPAEFCKLTWYLLSICICTLQLIYTLYVYMASAKVRHKTPKLAQLQKDRAYCYIGNSTKARRLWAWLVSARLSLTETRLSFLQLSQKPNICILSVWSEATNTLCDFTHKWYASYLYLRTRPIHLQLLRNKVILKMTTR